MKYVIDSSSKERLIKNMTKIIKKQKNKIEFIKARRTIFITFLSNKIYKIDKSSNRFVTSQKT